MIQLFYLKNLTSVSLIALSFSVMSLETMAEQESASVLKEKGPTLAPSEKMSEAPLPMPEPADKLEEPLLSGSIPKDMKPGFPNGESSMATSEMKDDMYQEMLESETQGAETPAPTLEERQALDRLQKLNETDELSEERPLPDLLDLPKQDEISSGILQEESRPEASSPEAAMPDSPKDGSMEPPVEATATPTGSILNLERTKPTVIMTPTAWDDEESREPQREEKPDDPTSEGQGPDGRHKMGKLRPSGPVIPIIRMGENSEKNRGFTII